ncbi:helix-turn-helix transcriptional regulator [Capnocytophaga gingivalis]|uniref:helix-turn-helix transcriptional regulator n=1 Tax=Capnocytophaga gingivalis TaxID=1017 RepID=UPI00058B0432|nr:helix-turn-helix transcriptional regulator [Capnocytophaga gingivalis]
MIPKRLRDARKNAGISQEKLAELVDVEGINIRSRISSYEVGRVEPSFNLMVKIAAVLNYPECYFYTIDDALAQTILEIHLNKNNSSHNPYLNTIHHAEKLCSELHDLLKKASAK